ncbi:O-antigen ligase family protein [Aliarcobacter butzleri]|uniref:O-antigen ligase family protein n=1 Tax=Aliarcobacter butzleri TaxID=28197 RepID=UPI0021B2D79F|nr:O-antigen ligase family protein [Aliarcobacter butzleri]MCT7550736.1 O-antigen ligase family protein [Aliarcobacter butzleri]MCT7559335.1 O-antigen ligase family protein [Aliarcobacter butzleri]
MFTCINKIDNLYFNLKDNSVLLANYFLIFYAFFLPISKDISNIAFTIVIILFFVNGNIKNKLKFALKDKVVFSILIFVAVHMLWFLGTDYFEYGIIKLSYMKHYLSIIIIVTMVLREFVIKIISAFVLSMLFSEICSYFIFFNFIEPFNNATKINPVPFMLNHTVYSVFLALSLGILLYNLFEKELKNNYISKLIILFFTITITFNILIISSRLGYILLFAVIFSMAIILFRKYIFKAIILAIVTIIIFYAIAYKNISNFEIRVNQVIQHTKQIFSEQDYTTSEGIRFGYYKYSLELLKESPIFGVGTGDHINYVKDKIKEYKNLEPMLAALGNGTNAGLHSDYFDVFVQFGLIGLVVFLNIFYQIINYKQKNLYFKYLQLLLVIVILVQSIPQGMIYLNPINKIFILLLAITLNLYQNKNYMSNK